MNAPAGYVPQAEDTSIESDVLFFHLLRKRTAQERLEIGMQMIRSGRQLSLLGLKRAFPDLAPEQFAAKVALAWLQEDCPVHYQPKGDELVWVHDPVVLAVQLHQIFTGLGVNYYVTGGVAAIAYGEPRTTRDLDLVLAIAPEAIDSLVAALESAGFYVPGVDDVRSGRMQILGITQVETISRADLIIAGTEEFDRVKFERRQALELPGTGTVYFISAEDLILSKLQWGQRSQSEKQWRDVLGVLKVQGTNLDLNYLRSWANEGGLSNLLEQALLEAGLKS